MILHLLSRGAAYGGKVRMSHGFLGRQPFLQSISACPEKQNEVNKPGDRIGVIYRENQWHRY